MSDSNETPKNDQTTSDDQSEFQAKASDFAAKLEDRFRALDHMSAREVGDAATKFASDTAYAAAGFAALVAEKAKDLADRKGTTTDSSTESSDAKAFVDQVNEQVSKFVDDLGSAYKDLSDRGRDAVAKRAQSGKSDAPKGDDAPGMFDIDPEDDAPAEGTEAPEHNDTPEA